MIICGDTIEELKKIPSESVDLIFADPPYWMRTNGKLHRVEGAEYNGCDDDWDNQFKSNNDYKIFTEKWLTGCKRVLKKDGSIWVIGSMQCIYTIGAIMQDLGFWFINDIIWHKKNPTPNFKGSRLNNSHETLIWAAKSEKSKFTFNYKTAKELNTDTVAEEDYKKGIRKQLGSVWRISVCKGNERLKNNKGTKLHNTQKPEELLYRIITISSKPGYTILDPFGGTMTTAAVAKRTGRDYIMIERNPEYCRYGKERLSRISADIGNVEKAVFDIPPPRVAMNNMIEDGFFNIGESFFLKDKSKEAILTGSGKLIFEGKEFDKHSCAAKANNKNTARINGFKVWHVIRNNKLVSIDDIRAEYRKTLDKT